MQVITPNPGEPPPPQELLRGSDGTALVYRRGRIELSAEPGHGKSWAALTLAAEVIREGGKVAWIDTDAMGRPAIVERLLVLGISQADGSRLFRWTPAAEDVDTNTLRAALLTPAWALAAWGSRFAPAPGLRALVALVADVHLTFDLLLGWGDGLCDGHVRSARWVVNPPAIQQFLNGDELNTRMF